MEEVWHQGGAHRRADGLADFDGFERYTNQVDDFRELYEVHLIAI